MTQTDDETMHELLELRTVAVIGCSSTEGKDAHEIPAYLQQHGYDVVPVNPYADEILGRTAYDTIADVKEEIDLVDVFRPSKEVPGIIETVIERKHDRGDVQGIWLQLGIRDDEAAARAEETGIRVVQDRCMKVEHKRLIDGE